MKFSDMLVKESAPPKSTLNLSDYPHFKDSDLFKVLRQLPKLSIYGPWVAGGSVWRTLNKEPLEKCDIDIFFQSQNQHDEVIRTMNSLPFVNNIVKETKNKWNTVYKCHVHEKKEFDKTIDVQFINMNFHPNLDSLLDSFDLTVCQFGFDGENLHCGPQAVADLAAKRIRLHSLRLPKTMLKHLHRYLSNGFTISSDETRELTYRLISANCWKKSDQPDYDGDEEKKEVVEKASYRSPFAGEWEGYGFAAAAADTARPNAPIVEEDEEDMEVDPMTLQPRPGNRARRGQRIENGGRRNRRVAVDAAPLQANTGWIPAGGNNNAMWGYVANAAGGGVAQWAPVNNAPQPAAPANQNPVVEVPIQENPLVAGMPMDLNVAQQPVAQANPQPVPLDNAADDNVDWEGYGYAARIDQVRNNAQAPVVAPPANEPGMPRLNGQQQRVMDQLDREGLLNIDHDGPEAQAQMNRALERAEELMRAEAQGVGFRANVYHEAARNLNEAYMEAQIRNAPVVVAQQQPANPPVANPPVERADENEIADNAAQQAERNELRDVFDDFFNA